LALTTTVDVAVTLVRLAPVRSDSWPVVRIWMPHWKLPLSANPTPQAPISDDWMRMPPISRE